MSVPERAQHFDNCARTTKQIVEQSTQQKMDEKEYRCIICEKDLSPCRLATRMKHIKECCQANNLVITDLSPGKIGKIVASRKQAAEKEVIPILEFVDAPLMLASTQAFNTTSSLISKSNNNSLLLDDADEDKLAAMLDEFEETPRLSSGTETQVMRLSPLSNNNSPIKSQQHNRNVITPSQAAQHQQEDGELEKYLDFNIPSPNDNSVSALYTKVLTIAFACGYSNHNYSSQRHSTTLGSYS